MFRAIAAVTLIAICFGMVTLVARTILVRPNETLNQTVKDIRCYHDCDWTKRPLVLSRLRRDNDR